MMFQSLTRDSNHSNRARGEMVEVDLPQFQSLTRDSNHSNPERAVAPQPEARFNPSRGIAIIQTLHLAPALAMRLVSIPHAG